MTAPDVDRKRPRAQDEHLTPFQAQVRAFACKFNVYCGQSCTRYISYGVLREELEGLGRYEKKNEKKLGTSRGPHPAPNTPPSCHTVPSHHADHLYKCTAIL